MLDMFTHVENTVYGLARKWCLGRMLQMAL